MTSLKVFATLFLVLSLPHPAASQASSSITAKGFLAEYVENLKAKQGAVFVASCQLEKDIKALIVLEPGKSQGTFLMINDQIKGTTGALAGVTGKIDFLKNEPQIEIDTIYPEARSLYEKLARRVSTFPFWILPVELSDKIYSESAKESC